jgi:cytochrome c-type biogenesis protein CcmH
MRRALALAALLALAMPAAALTPDELLEDPVLEQRAREISSQLRCMVCQSESIDESNADLARDMRLLVRERLVAGDSDDEVMSFIVDRYGEYALLRPTTEGANLILWIAGPAMLGVALLLGGGYVLRQRKVGAGEATLSEADKARLETLLKE